LKSLLYFCCETEIEEKSSVQEISIVIFQCGTFYLPY